MLDTGLKGKKALVTGGGVGIGFAIARKLAEEGVDVAIANRSAYPDSIRELESFGVKAVGIQADVGKESDVIRMVQEATAGLGGLDVYVNNVAAHWDEPALKTTAENWYKTVNTNLSACVFACREVGNLFVKQGSGGILIIGSTASSAVLPGEYAYRVTKTALVPYMQALAAELAPFKIRVNMLTPGLFMTRMTKDLDFEGDMLQTILKDIPLRCAGDSYESLAPAAVLLLSDTLSGYTTGSNLIVDGGLSMNVMAWRSEEELRDMSL
jgi:NAD(P)-dependent dehydrogenase (short-subunit alcohol dehydrogenase family)